MGTGGMVRKVQPEPSDGKGYGFKSYAYSNTTALWSHSYARLGPIFYPISQQKMTFLILSLQKANSCSKDSCFVFRVHYFALS